MRNGLIEYMNETPSDFLIFPHKYFTTIVVTRKVSPQESFFLSNKLLQTFSYSLMLSDKIYINLIYVFLQVARDRIGQGMRAVLSVA